MLNDGCMLLRPGGVHSGMSTLAEPSLPTEVAGCKGGTDPGAVAVTAEASTFAGSTVSG